MPAAVPDLPNPPPEAGPRRGLWIHVGRGIPRSWWHALLAGLSRAHSRLTPVVSFDAAPDREGAKPPPGVRAVALPAGRRGPIRRFFAREKPKLLVMVGACPDLPPAVLRRTSRRGVPVLWIAAAVAADAAGVRRDAARIDLACVAGAAVAAALARRGLTAERVQVVAPVGGAPPVDAACAAAARLLLRGRGAGPHEVRGGRLGRLLDTAPGRRVEARFAQRLDGIEALREALGRPRHLLCLGNGPSSEEPGLARLAPDRCFRVNASWKGRGVWEAPDMVFTGNRTSLTRSPGTIFGFRDLREERLLVSRWIRRVRTPRLRYFTFGRHLDWLDEARLPARPTNGAVMLATAVALAPARLTVAGIDLFAHPAGAYPGDLGTPNAYAPVHARDVELRVLCGLLARFDGDVVVAGPVLPAALAGAGVRGFRTLDDAGLQASTGRPFRPDPPPPATAAGVP